MEHMALSWTLVSLANHTSPSLASELILTSILLLHLTSQHFELGSPFENDAAYCTVLSQPCEARSFDARRP